MVYKNTIPLTDQDKIDAIYEMLRKQESREKMRRIWRWIWIVTTIFFLWQTYILLTAGEDSKFMTNMQSFIGKQMWNLVWPIVDNVLKNNPQLTPSGPMPSDLWTGAPVTHVNKPQTRNVNELIKDHALLKAAADAYAKRTAN
jgi:hypothetical protein